MDGRADLVLDVDRHLKWPALDPLERALMQLCGVCLIGFTSTTLLDVVARIAGHPVDVDPMSFESGLSISWINVSLTDSTSGSSS